MKQRFPRGTRPLVGVAVLFFAASAVAALRHVARNWARLHSGLAVLQVTVGADEKVRGEALDRLRALGPLAVPSIATRGREKGLPDDLFAILALHAGPAELDLLAASVVGTDEPRRLAAVEALGRIRTAEAALAAAPALTDPSPAVHLAGRRAVRGQSAETFAAILTVCLGSAGAVPEGIARMIVEEGAGLSAIGPVAEAIASTEPIRLWNGLHVGLILFRDHPPGRDHKRPLIDALAGALPRAEAGAQAVVVAILAGMNDPGRYVVLRGVAESNRFSWELRTEAIRALGAVPHPEAVRTLESLVRAGPGAVRFPAAEALGGIGSPEDAARWLGVIESGVREHDAREGLVRAIGLCGRADLVPRLLARFRIQDSPGLASALRLVALRDPVGAAPALIEGLKVAEPAHLGLLNVLLSDVTWHRAVWNGDARTAAEFARAREQSAADWDAWWRKNGKKSLAEWQTAGLQETETDLRDRAVQVRFHAVARLVALKPADLDTRLASLVADPEDLIWGRAWAELSQMIAPGSLSVLRETLARGEGRPAIRAARALGHTRDRDSAGVLLEALSRPDPELRTAAALALGQLEHAPAARTLAACLRDEVHTVRLAARDALELIASPTIERELIGGLADPSEEHRASCAWLLGVCGTESSIRPLAALFQDRNELVSRAALRSVQLLTGRMPVIRPAEHELARWEELARRKRRDP